MNWIIFLTAVFVPLTVVAVIVEYWQWNIRKADERKRDYEFDTRNSYSNNTAGEHSDTAYAATLRLFYE